MRPEWPFWKHRAPKSALGRITMCQPETFLPPNPTSESSHFSGLSKVTSLNCQCPLCHQIGLLTYTIESLMPKLAQPRCANLMFSLELISQRGRGVELKGVRSKFLLRRFLLFQEGFRREKGLLRSLWKPSKNPFFSKKAFGYWQRQNNYIKIFSQN